MSGRDPLHPLATVVHPLTIQGLGEVVPLVLNGMTLVAAHDQDHQILNSAHGMLHTQTKNHV